MPEHIVKACPRCGQPLEIKRNRSYTEPLPEAIRLRRQGQRGMFDEELPL
jgi:hypothetical protein